MKLGSLKKCMAVGLVIAMSLGVGACGNTQQAGDSAETKSVAVASTQGKWLRPTM